MITPGSRCIAADNLETARAKALQAVADSSAAMLPIIGTWACAVGVSLFVEVPYSSVTRFQSGRALRTELRARSYAGVILAVPPMVHGQGEFGFLLAYRPLILGGDEFQPEGRDSAIAVVDGAFPTGQSSREQLLGPDRCARCNYTIPVARVRMTGSPTLCVRCKSTEETML